MNEVFVNPYQSLMTTLAAEVKSAGRLGNPFENLASWSVQGHMDEVANLKGRIANLKNTIHEMNTSIGPLKEKAEQASSRAQKAMVAAGVGVPVAGAGSFALGRATAHEKSAASMGDAAAWANKVKDKAVAGWGYLKSNVDKETMTRAALGGIGSGAVSAIHQKGNPDGKVNLWRVAEHAAVGGTIGAASHKLEAGARRVGQFFDATEKAYQTVPQLHQDVNTLLGKLKDEPVKSWWKMRFGKGQ